MPASAGMTDPLRHSRESGNPEADCCRPHDLPPAPTNGTVAAAGTLSFPRKRESRMHNKAPAVYIQASRRNGTLYVGVTSDLIKRGFEHREGLIDGFTRRHGVHLLVYFEMHASMEAAITREKQLKKWNRRWKLELIESDNPGWRDLWPDLLGS